MDRKSIVDFASDGHYDKLKEALDNVDSENSRLPYNLALYSAAHAGHLSCVEILVEHGAEVDEVSGLDHKHGRTPLFIATIHNRRNVVKYLLSKTKDIDKCDAHGQSLMHIAAERGYVEIMEDLLTYGAKKFNSTTDNHPLYLAARNGGVAACKCLIEWGCDAHMVDSQGRTMLHISGTKTVAELALELGLPINLQNRYGITALMKIVRERRIPTLKLLLKYGADPFITNTKGESAFYNYVSTYSINTDVLKLMLDMAVTKNQISSVTKGGETPLSKVCLLPGIKLKTDFFTKQVDIISILLQAGASCKDHTFKDKRYGVNLLSFVLKSIKCVELMDLFLTHGDYTNKDIKEWFDGQKSVLTKPAEGGEKAALDLVENYIINVKSLKNIVRLQIRHCFCTPITRKYLDTLPIPKTMKEFLA